VASPAALPGTSTRLATVSTVQATLFFKWWGWQLDMRRNGMVNCTPSSSKSSVAYTIAATL
jgi:hypothetical protein